MRSLCTWAPDSTHPAGDWQGFLGAAFEYDFTDTIRNEAGIHHAKAGSPWLFDMRLRGYCGKREGASLKLQAEYGF